MEILNTIRNLLTWKNVATIAEIAKISEKKQKDVLQVLINNKNFLVKDKNGRITRITESYKQLKRPQLYYTLEGINYGADKRIICSDDTIVKHLYQSYWCGGIGDCYEINVLLHNEQNIKAIRELGFIHYDECEYNTINDLWME